MSWSTASFRALCSNSLPSMYNYKEIPGDKFIKFEVLKNVNDKAVNNIYRSTKIKTSKSMLESLLYMLYLLDWLRSFIPVHWSFLGFFFFFYMYVMLIYIRIIFINETLDYGVLQRRSSDQLVTHSVPDAR